MEFPEKSIWTGNDKRISELDVMVSPGKTAADHDFEVTKNANSSVKQRGNRMSQKSYFFGSLFRPPEIVPNRVV